MGSFFGKPQYGTPQGAYSIEHLGFVFFIYYSYDYISNCFRFKKQK